MDGRGRKKQNYDGGTLATSKYGGVPDANIRMFYTIRCGSHYAKQIKRFNVEFWFFFFIFIFFYFCDRLEDKF